MRKAAAGDGAETGGVSESVMNGCGARAVSPAR